MDLSSVLPPQPTKNIGWKVPLYTSVEDRSREGDLGGEFMESLNFAIFFCKNLIINVLNNKNFIILNNTFFIK
jgi:hypothetical protein